jgi:predicted KAP-like P-loop ATPase
MSDDPAIEPDSEPPLLSPDRPISTSGEDELGRLQFARDIASAISAWHDKDSLVFALVGAWGDGKTSIKNLVLEQLTARAAPGKPSVLEFVPWEWAAQDRIVAAFFDEMAAELKYVDPSDQGRKRTEAFVQYGELLQAASKSVAGIPAVLTALIAGAAALGISQLTTGTGKTVFALLALLFIFVGALVAVSGSALTAIGQFRTGRAERRQVTVRQRKQRLAALMATGMPSAPLLVVMDDLDRLDADELRNVLQLIRANADLPNLVYLLLYDEEVISNTLDHVYGGHGRDALAKVVNVRLQVPRVEASRLTQLGKSRVRSAIERSGQTLDELYWENLAASGWGDLLENVRSVKRFMNLYSLHLSLMVRDGVLEVQPADLAAIDLLAIVEPKLHEALPKAKDLLTRDARSDDKANRRRQLDQLIETASERHRAAVSQLLMRLFPPLESVVGNTYHADFQYQEWWARRRVCSILAFDIYFTLTVPSNEASGSQVRALARSTLDEDDFIGHLREVSEAGVLRSALNQLDLDLIPVERSSTILRGFFRAGETFLHTERALPMQGLDEAAAAATIRRVCRDRLDEDKYLDEYIAAMTETSSVYLPAYLASWELDPNSLQGPLKEGSATRLREACVAAIKSAAAAGTLINMPGLAFLLYRWKVWGDAEEVEKWLQAQVTTAEDIAEFAARFGGYHTAGPVTDPVHRATFKANRDVLAGLVGEAYLEKIEGHEPPPEEPSAPNEPEAQSEG